jgi:hypothetical protein
MATGTREGHEPRSHDACSVSACRRTQRCARGPSRGSSGGRVIPEVCLAGEGSSVTTLRGGTPVASRCSMQPDCAVSLAQSELRYRRWRAVTECRPERAPMRSCVTCYRSAAAHAEHPLLKGIDAQRWPHGSIHHRQNFGIRSTAALTILHMTGITVWLQGARCLYGEGVHGWLVQYC